MKITLFLLALILLNSEHLIAQNTSVSPATQVQPLSINGDTTINIILDEKLQIANPGFPTEYSISSYKNVDYLKTNPQQLEAAGLHPQIYISNTHKGVIIISSAESNETLKNFNKTLELNPTYFESLTRQDTIIFAPADNQKQEFDFTKASFITKDYKNAFNNTVDPRTGVFWSQGIHKDFIHNDILSKELYDLIIVLPKK